MKKYNCKFCNEEFDTIRETMYHVTHSHKKLIKAKAYYETHIMPDNICVYCNENTIPYSKRFSDYCCDIHKNNHSLVLKGKLNHICELCGAGFYNPGGLGRHISETHNIKISEYYKRFVWKDGEPDGNCLWCGEDVGFNTITKGFNKFCYNKDCNVLWYNKNTDRLSVSGKNISKAKKENPQNNITRIEYYMNKGMCEHQAKAELAKRQTTFSKKICIEKHGKVKGLEIWNDRQEKYMSTMNSKSDEEMLEINKRKIPYTRSCYSVSSAEYEIAEKLSMGQQLVIERDDVNSHYVYDLYEGNKIIEYNGDYWHCNPIKYNSDYYHSRVKMTANDIWEKDRRKIEFAKSKGYDILVIWENDYIKDPERELNRCIEFLKS